MAGLARLCRSFEVIVRRMCTDLTLSRLAQAIALLVFMQAPSLGQTEMTTDLEFRGQGPNNICFSFAEEQMLKDVLCKSDCATNANSWHISIFDIIKLHTAEDIRAIPERIEKDRLKYTFQSGSRFVFPYHDKVTVRASKCTLERELFYFNRSLQTNPRGLPLREQLGDFFDDTLAGVSLISTIPELRELSAVLIRLSRESKSAPDFFEKAVSYTSCSDQVEIPRLRVSRELSRDETQIRSTIVAKLSEGRSIFAAVCSEALRSENGEGKICGGHAVVFKELRSSTEDPGTFEVRVVDSSFFSKRQRNPDGSIWIPLEVAVMSTRLNLNRIDGMRPKISKEFRDLRREAVLGIRSSHHTISRVILEDFLALDASEQAVALISLSHRLIQSQPGAGDDLAESFKVAVAREFQRQEAARQEPERYMGEGLFWFE